MSESQVKKIIIHEAHSLHIPATPFKVLATMNAMKGDYGLSPQEEIISKRAEIPLRSVQRAKKWLEEHKYIKWDAARLARRRGSYCSYLIHDHCYSPPDGWDSSGHYMLDARESKKFSADEWRLLCLFNTAAGWGIEKSSMKELIIRWGMDKRTIRKVWDGLSEKGDLSFHGKISSHLFFKNKPQE